MRFGSLCSGIDGAAVAWPDWEQAYCAEIDPFCCRLLARHYPDVPNFGDITVPRDWPAVDVLVAGTPCQSFSVNGKREGFDDARGQVAHAFAEVLRQTQPPAFVWENVCGVLSSNSGRDFGAFIGSLAECGYDLGWRVLDSRGFGIPQRRQRLFVVGVRGNPGGIARVLFDSEPSEAAHSTIEKTRKANPRILGWSGDETPKFSPEVMPTLRASQGGEGVGILTKNVCRNLTIAEWERLSGFPVDYTKGGTDRERRRVLGNSFCPAILAWIGRRIEQVIQPTAPAPTPQALTLQRISSQLAAVVHVDEAKEIRSKAEAVRVYAQAMGNSRDIERAAIVVRLRAERRIGELLSKSVRRGNPKLTPGSSLTLPAGITPKQSSLFQRVAKVPESKFDKYLLTPNPSTKGAASLVKTSKAEPELDEIVETTIARLRSTIARRLEVEPDSAKVTRLIKRHLV